MSAESVNPIRGLDPFWYGILTDGPATAIIVWSLLLEFGDGWRCRLALAPARFMAWRAEATWSL